MHHVSRCLRRGQYSASPGGLCKASYRLVSNATGACNLDGGQVAEVQQSWEDYHSREVGRRPIDNRDVDTEDLAATLEAHRDRNRASVIRKIHAEPEVPLPFKRPEIQRITPEPQVDGDIRDSTTNSTAKGSEPRAAAKESQHDSNKVRTKSPRIWPADSVQYRQEISGRGRKRHLVESRRISVKSHRDLEYEGVAMKPKKTWGLDPHSRVSLQKPWISYMGKPSATTTESMSEEIRAFERYMRLTPAEETAAQLVLTDIKSVTQKNIRNATLTVLGSRTTGLATPLSDFDLTFSMHSDNQDFEYESTESNPRVATKKAVTILKKLEKDFRSSKILQDTELVRARVPIIQTRHRATKLRIQVQTMASYRQVQEFTAAYLNEVPSLRPLYIVLRYALEIRNLTTVFEGGLGSYPLVMMIVTALKHSGGTFAADDLAGQLLHVLYFYGTADLYKNGFSANPPRIYDKHVNSRTVTDQLDTAQDPQLEGINDILRKRDSKKPYLLSLQDPADSFNDLGKKAYAIKHIQATFKTAHQGISWALQQGDTRSDSDKKDGTWSFLDFLLKANYTAFERDRSQVERSIDPTLSRDRNFSEARIMKDFLGRVDMHRGKMEEDEYGHSLNQSNSQDAISKKGRAKPGLIEAGVTINNLSAKEGIGAKKSTSSTHNVERLIRRLDTKTSHLRQEANAITKRLARIDVLQMEIGQSNETGLVQGQGQVPGNSRKQSSHTENSMDATNEPGALAAKCDLLNLAQVKRYHTLQREITQLRQSKHEWEERRSIAETTSSKRTAGLQIQALGERLQEAKSEITNAQTELKKLRDYNKKRHLELHPVKVIAEEHP